MANPMSKQPSGDWLPEYPPCLLPDDDTAVERLAAALMSSDWIRDLGDSEDAAEWRAREAAAIIAALREGGQG